MSARPCAMILRVFGVVVLVGCTTVQLNPQILKDPILTDLQQFANRTQAVYGLWLPTRVGWQSFYWSASGYEIPGAAYIQGDIVVNPRWRTSPHLVPLMAHELGHRVLHTMSLGPTPGREMEANAKAVEILHRVLGQPEPDALEAMYQLLRFAFQTGATAAHHAPPCDEIRDLLGRFPQYRDRWQTWRCAPHDPTSSQDQDPASR